MRIGLRGQLLLGMWAIITACAAVALLLWPEAFRAVAVVAGGAGLAAWLATFVGNRRLQASLGRMRRAADAIGRGDFSCKVPVHPRDELAKLARAFNQMAERLEKTVQKEQRLEEQLTRSEKLALIGELAATMAHEVNNPLDGIQNCSRIIRRNLDDPQQVRRLLDLMDTGLYRIEMVVRRFLTLSREGVSRLVPTRLDEVVNDAVVFVAPRITKRRIELTTEAPQMPVFAQADRQLLGQALINLMVNAADSLADRGRLTVRIHQPEPGDTVVKLSVEDTGCGIAPEHLPHIFEPFYSTKGQGGGTGLGLAVVARIVKAHGGQIHVQTEPGKGTTFTLELPRAAAADPADPAGRVVASGASSP